jgi:lipid A 3-O-deacylase
VTAGNIMTFGDVGGLLRIGKGLQADYGPIRVRPALSGTDYFDAAALDGEVGWYFFASAQGRAVGRNIFLDGNTFRRSLSVSKKNFVADLPAAFRWCGRNRSGSMSASCAALRNFAASRRLTRSARWP